MADFSAIFCIGTRIDEFRINTFIHINIDTKKWEKLLELT